METAQPPIPFDPHGLVALNFLYFRDHPLHLIEIEPKRRHEERQRDIDRGIIHHDEKGTQRDSGGDPPFVRAWSGEMLSPAHRVVRSGKLGTAGGGSGVVTRSDAV